jgi:hypothetical protein
VALIYCHENRTNQHTLSLQNAHLALPDAFMPDGNETICTVR